jgi:hypothetical protein
MKVVMITTGMWRVTVRGPSVETMKAVLPTDRTEVLEMRGPLSQKIIAVDDRPSHNTLNVLCADDKPVSLERSAIHLDVPETEEAPILDPEPKASPSKGGEDTARRTSVESRDSPSSSLSSTPVLPSLSLPVVERAALSFWVGDEEVRRSLPLYT